MSPILSVEERRGSTGARARRGKIAAVGASGVAYGLVLVLFMGRLEYQVFIVSAVPVLTAAWAFGLSGAGVAGLGVTIVHVLVINAHGSSVMEWLAAGGGMGTAAVFLVGGLIGYIGTLRTRLDRERRVLLQTQDVTIFALAYQAELRDQATGQHLERTSKYVRMLAEEIARSPRYAEYLTKSYISDLVRAAPLHDIGKVGVPDSILLKPGKLSATEFQIMQEHCELGAQVLRMADGKLQFQSFLRIAIQIALCHHEKWDGTGYPAGLAGEEIPLSGRIMALADVYDALRSERSYKSAFEHARCVEIICADRGSHFDPELVDAFLRLEEEFRAVSTALSDPGASDEIGTLLEVNATSPSRGDE